MSEKKVFDKFEAGKSEYSFIFNDEYNGHVFHKFQKKTVDNKGNVKWQTLTIKPDDFGDFVEWMKYIISEVSGTPGEDVPF